MDTNLVFTGVLPATLIVSALLTTLVSVSLLWLYRSAVLKGMNVPARTEDVVTPTSVQSTARPRDKLPLAITTINYTASFIPRTGFSPLDRAVSRSLQQVALTYVLAGLAYALVFSLAWIMIDPTQLRWSVVLWLLLCYAWPVALAVSIVIAIGQRERILIIAGYFALYTMLSVILIVYSTRLNAVDLIVGWLFLNGPASLLLLAFLARRVRAVGPLVLAFMMAGTTGAILLSEVIGRSDVPLRLAISSALSLGLGATTVFVLLNLLGFVLFGIVIWQLLLWIGRRYQRKCMSDQALTLDALWLLFASAQAMVLAINGSVWILTGLVAFAVYKYVLGLANTRLVQPRITDTPGVTLLLLRVFSLGSRSQQLFDAFSKRWLRIGSISLIAGPDLVEAIVEPHEFLDFLGGRLSRQFIRSPEHLGQRLAEMDRLPDPDGRFRVNEFFCRADTWQMTMHQLATSSAIVLMDLRSFSPGNKGCLYELGQLINHIALTQVILIVDQSTDQPFLQKNLQTLWAELADNSPNWHLPSPEFKLFFVQSATGVEVYALIRLLFSMLTTQQAGKR